VERVSLPERRADCPDAEPVPSSPLGRVEEQVQSRLGSQVRHFRLLARGGGLVLKGSALTYYAKQLAQHAVMRSVLLPILANEIEVA
jgi:hypothetical protein